MDTIKGKYRLYWWVLHGFFLLVYSALSLLNHYYFRSSGLDYGLANQALYHYAHFEPASITQLLGGGQLPYLACHLSFWVPLFSPLYWIFGSYTLLLVQLFALVFAIKGIQKLVQDSGIEEWVALLIGLQLYCSLFVFAAYGFDYHDNVIGAAFFPWLIRYFRKGKWVQTILCFIAILGSKENMAIWAGFVSLSLPFLAVERTKKVYLFSLILFVFSLFYYLLAAFYLMPALAGGEGFLQLQRYSHLGGSFSEIISYIFNHPWDTFSLFWKSHVQPDGEEIIKREFWKVLLVSGGIALIRKPQFLWMALPLLMQKLWNKETAFWGIAYHYQIELAILISVAMWFWLKDMTNMRHQFFLLMFVLLCTIGISVRKFNERYASYQPVKENILSTVHYRADFDVAKVSKKLKEIPTNAAVCAQANLMPHIAFRDKLYHFPFVKDASYLVFLQPGLNTYPLNEQEANKYIDSIRACPNWVEDSSALPLHVLVKK
jgi:uncharacterized membrane protein